MAFDLIGRFNHKDVFVLANGPSLRDIRLDLLPQERTIGVNRIHWSGYDPGYLVVVDGDAWKDIRDDALKAKCHLLIGTDPTRRALYDQVYSELPINRSTYFVWDNDAPVWGGRIKRGITGFIAAQIAARMAEPGGCVWLCGMDLQYREGEPTHSYDEQGTGTRDAPFPAAVRDFVRLRAALTGNVRFVIVGRSLLCAHDFHCVSTESFNEMLVASG